MTTRANMPLAGITVLDFGQVYQGPYATLLMATAGADVIKIEPPNGEPLRRRAPPGKSTTFPIAMRNSHKRSVTGVGRRAEGPMQEAAYPTLTSQPEAYRRTGKVPRRTANASHTRVPIN